MMHALGNGAEWMENISLILKKIKLTLKQISNACFEVPQKRKNMDTCIASSTFATLLYQINQLNSTFQSKKTWIGCAERRDPARRRKGGRTSSACSLHAPNPLLSSTCHTLTAKWNWLLISFLPQVSGDGGLRWARWEGLVGDRRAGAESYTKRKRTDASSY